MFLRNAAGESGGITLLTKLFEGRKRNWKTRKSIFHSVNPFHSIGALYHTKGKSHLGFIAIHKYAIHKNYIFSSPEISEIMKSFQRYFFSIQKCFEFLLARFSSLHSLNSIFIIVSSFRKILSAIFRKLYTNNFFLFIFSFYSFSFFREKKRFLNINPKFIRKKLWIHKKKSADKRTRPSLNEKNIKQTMNNHGMNFRQLYCFLWMHLDLNHHLSFSTFLFPSW